MKSKRCITLGIVLTLFYNHVAAQPGHMEIGKPAPEFTIHNVTHFTAKQIASKDLMGKWTIFDFWSRGCATCIEAFPKVNKLQLEFSNGIQFLLVASNDRVHGTGVQAFYERFARNYSLVIPSAYDSALFTQFGVSALPHIAIIDPKGIVRAVTTSENLTSANLKRMIQGDMPYFRLHPSMMDSDSEMKLRPDLVSSEQDPSVNEFRSVFSKWNPNQPIQVQLSIAAHSAEGYFRTTQTALNKLYNIAYAGASDWSFNDPLYKEYCTYPIIETTDSIPFKIDFNRSEGLYNYSITVPREHANTTDIQRAMQLDLQKYFGYDVKTEIRMMPCYELVKLPGKTSLTAASNTVTKVKNNYTGVEIVNGTVNQLVRTISSYHFDKRPFFDNTGITENIDLTLDVVVTDFEALRKSLNKHGLDLVKKVRPIKVIVIR